MGIISEITAEEAATLQPLVKSLSTTTKPTNKCRGATSRGAAVPEEPETKRARSTQSTPAATDGTPLTSPTPRQKKKKYATTAQGSPKDCLRSATKKK